jgi:hypothetical protein
MSFILPNIQVSVLIIRAYGPFFFFLINNSDLIEKKGLSPRTRKSIQYGLNPRAYRPL